VELNRYKKKGIEVALRKGKGVGGEIGDDGEKLRKAISK
jgi:hypothetical protein